MDKAYATARRLNDIKQAYEMGPVLATGGFSAVHTATALDSKKKVAIKVMEKKALHGNRAKMVKREYEILSRCRHPNILTLYEVVETPNTVCLVMEMVAGGDLFESISTRKTLTELEAAKIIRCILQSVSYLHDAQPPVVHRDIKPENILIEDIDGERVKLCDFGLAKVLVGDPSSMVCTPAGTSFYIPPETLQGIKKHGSKPRPTNVPAMLALDIWSTGIVLYILLCGRPPFRGSIATPQEQANLLAQIRQGVTFPANRWEGVSDEAKDLIRNMLQLDALKRFTTRQCLEHRWFKTTSKAVLQTPNVLMTEYKDKRDFHDQVNGACGGTDEKQTQKQVDESTVGAKLDAPAVAKPGQSALLAKRMAAKQAAGGGA